MTTRIKIPERYSKILANSKCYVGLMGLSVGKQDFENQDTMASYCNFMQDNFRYGLFLIGDYPKKYNIMALEGTSERAAEERTRIAGDNMRNALEKVTRDYPLVKVARWKHFMSPEYTHNLEILRRSYSTDEKFQEECNHTVWNFLSQGTNTKRNNPNISMSDKISVSKEYLLDELALLVAAPFSFPLPVCEIHPGRNEVHEQVQNREFPFCKDLYIKDDRVFMEAHYERGD